MLLTPNTIFSNLTPLNFMTAIRKTLEAILTASVILVYGVGSAAAIEYQHMHENCRAPHTSHHDDGHHDSHHHHHHGEDKGETDQDSPIEGKDSSPQPHSHFISFDTQVTSNLSVSLNLPSFPYTDSRLIHEKDLRPDAPFREVPKPPQLG